MLSPPYSSWLTEDESEELFTPYESENEEALDVGFGEHDQSTKQDNGGERIMTEETGRRRADLRDFQSSRARSLSRDRVWYEGSGTYCEAINTSTKVGTA